MRGYGVRTVPFNEFRRLAEPEALTDHWREFAEDQERVPLDPDWPVYEAREAAGELVTMILESPRRELAGYFLAFVAPGLHYRTCLTATMDILFILPAWRDKPTLARKLLSAAERELAARGVQRVYLGSKLHKDVGRLFERLGYGPADMYYSKLLG